jgi:hypothetical protein
MPRPLYLVVGVDQDGDAWWDVFLHESDALKAAAETNECCYEKLKVHRISSDDKTITTTEVKY